MSSKKKGLKKSDQTNNPTKSTQPKQLGNCRVEQSQNKSEQKSHNPTKTTPQLRYEWGFLFFIVIIKFNEELINWNHKGFRLGLKILNSIDFSMNG